MPASGPGAAQPPGDGDGAAGRAELLPIAAKRIVRIAYAVRDGAGEPLESVDDFTYFHGAAAGIEQLPPGVERALVGLRAGESADVALAPADGYGERDPEAVFAVPRATFPAEAAPVPGQAVLVENEDGDTVPVWIVEVGDEWVIVDPNHPLAGRTVQFHVEVRAVREATAEEVARAAIPKGRRRR